MKSRCRVIGLIGGMGPYADIDVLHQIRNFSNIKREQEHIPVILISFPSEIVDRSEFIMGKIKENPGDEIYKILKILYNSGAKVIGVPCATAHSPPIFNRIQELVKRDNLNVKIVHIIHELGRYLKENFEDRRVGILSTYGAYLGGAYSILKKYGIEIVFPDEDVRKIVHDAIYNPHLGIKTKPHGTDYSITQITIAMENLREKNVKTIVLGCTEIPLIIKKRRMGDIKIVNINEILARALIRESCGEECGQ